MNRRRVRPVSLVALAAVCTAALIGTAGAAQAVVTPDNIGASLGQATVADSATYVASPLVTRPTAGAPFADAVSTTKLGEFPTDGASYAVLTTGDASKVATPGSFMNTGLNSTADATRGGYARDVSVLRTDVKVPTGANCLTFDFKFLSEEYPAWVGTSYNDGFVAELDKTTWKTSGGAAPVITSPDNFAFDGTGKVVSINSTGVGGMSAANGVGTAFNGQALITGSSNRTGGATGLLRASTRVTAGQHSVYFSIFDNGDNLYDSAVFLDNLRVGYVPSPATNCKAGAQVARFSLDVMGSGTKSSTIGQPSATQFKLTNAQTGAALANTPVKVAISGANPQTTTVTTDANGLATLTYTGAATGVDQIGACYQPADADACLATASATVNWRGIVVVAANSYTVSYGAATPQIGYTVSGAENNPTPVSEWGITCGVDGDHSQVGTYPTTCTGPVGANNDDVHYAAGTLTVTQAAITVTADNQTITYGDPDPQFTATTAGLLGNDQLVTDATCTVAGDHSDAGTYPITCSGADAGGNYETTYAAGTLTVKKAPALITADNATITYGDAEPQFTSQVTGLLGHDSPVTDATCDVSGNHTHVGSYAIECSGADLGGNYTPSYVDGTLTVKKAAAVVTADNQTVTYGDPSPGFTYGTAGLVGDDQLVDAPVCSVTGAHTAVGTYPIVCTGADAGDDYTTSSVNGTLTVTKAKATVTADNQTITYGDADPTFTYATGGTLTGDHLGAQVSCDVAGAHRNAGSYPITCTGPSDDGTYDIAYVAGTLTVKKAAATLTADNQAITYGDADPQFTYQVNGLLGGDHLVKAPVCAVAGAHRNAGSYPVTCTGADAGGNYTLATVDGGLTVQPAAVTVTADNKSVTFGQADPAFTWSVNGLIGGDQLTKAPACTVTGSHTAGGTYPIACTGASAGGNYTVKYVNGTLTVAKAGTALQMTPLVLGLLRPTATLTRTDTGAGIPGQTVTFSVGSTKVCSAVTNSKGVATCSNTLLVTILTKATATFAATGDYAGSKDDAGLLFG